MGARNFKIQLNNLSYILFVVFDTRMKRLVELVECVCVKVEDLGSIPSVLPFVSFSYFSSLFVILFVCVMGPVLLGPTPSHSFLLLPHLSIPHPLLFYFILFFFFYFVCVYYLQILKIQNVYYNIRIFY